MNTLAPAANRVPATAPQRDFITALLRDRDVPADLAQVTRTALDAAPGILTKAAASRLITKLKTCRYAPRTAAAPAAQPAPATPPDVAVAPVADDFTGVEGPADRPAPAAPALTPAKGDVLLSPATNTVIRVRQSQQGNLYALTRPADARATDTAPLPAFTYAPGLLRNLPADTRRLTLTEATAISAAWGECFRCGRTLTDPTSVTRGIGPVCITYVQS